MSTAHASPWTIDVFALCKEHASKQGELPINLLTRLASDLTRHDGALHYELSGELDEKKHSIMHIRITGTLMMRCQRCLEEMAYAVDVDNSLELVHTEAELDDEEEELNAIAAGTAGIEKIVGSKTFDTFALMEDEIILSLPIVIAHEQCDKTLPMSAGEKASPFDALRTLKNQ
jgi:uncharacterized protein